MNIFVLHVLSSVAADMHCDLHFKMILETVQLLYTAIEAAGATLPPHPDPNVKPYKSTHKHHPCALWAPASRAHMKWLLDLGFFLSKRFAERGYEHKSAVHIYHMRANLDLSQFPASCQPLEWYDNMIKAGIKESVADAAYGSVATINPPSGCEFGVVTIPDEAWDDCVVMSNKADIDLVASYRNFYVFKSKRKFVMKWSGSFDPPCCFDGVFNTKFASESAMTVAPSRKRVMEEEADAPPKRAKRSKAA
jgi:hypothetical protein